MPLYKVKLTYPTVLVIQDKTYHLFPGKEVELPPAETARIVKAYLKLGYLEQVKPDFEQAEHKEKAENTEEIKETKEVENLQEGGK